MSAKPHLNSLAAQPRPLECLSGLHDWLAEGRQRLAILNHFRGQVDKAKSEIERNQRRFIIPRHFDKLALERNLDLLLVALDEAKEV